MFMPTTRSAGIGPSPSSGVAQTVNNTALERVADRHLQRSAGRGHFTARVDPVNLSQRHQQEMMVAKTNNLCQRSSVMLRGFNPTDLPYRRERPL